MIAWYQPHLWGNEKEYVLDAIESTWISGGKYVDLLEQEMSKVTECKHTITTSNGTTSLLLSYLTLGLKPGDEVIVPGFTFAAPVNMALAIGLTPVFADVDPETWLLCPKSVEENITKKTKAIIPVHIYGNVCDMESINRIATEHKLFVIEDVAEAAFSTYYGKQAGNLGSIGSFSFQATKTITTGEGGAITLNDKELYDQAKLIRNHGMNESRRYWHHVVGHNFRLTNMQAAIGYAQLEKLDEIRKNKKRVYEKYVSLLSNCPNIKLQKITQGCDPVMWAIAVCFCHKDDDSYRDRVIDMMKAKGIETRPGFVSFSEMPLYECGSIPVSDKISKSIISLPSWTMISDREIEHICKTFIEIVSG